MGDFTPTAEQQAAVDLARSGKTFVVDACAGSGKTSTAKSMCDVLGGRVLYLVFNTAAKNEALKKFPKSVQVRTTMSLAWRAYADNYADRMSPQAPRVPARETAKLAGISHPVELGEDILIPPVMLARMATETIDRFCFSADEAITDKHVPGTSMPVNLEQIQADHLRSEVAVAARKIWRQALSPTSKHRFTMSYAFKLLVSSAPQLGFDTIILDEAQDSNPATEMLVKTQNCQNIVVGDPGQQIYGWRGAVDIMSNFDGPRLPLSKSFRFGPAIAEEAEKWLEHTGTGIHITGNEKLFSRVGIGQLYSPKAVLCRTNGGVMKECLDFLDDGKRVAVAGGVQALKSLAYAAGDLKKGKQPSHPELAAFTTWDELVEYTEEPGGGDLKVFVQLINQYGVPGILDACNALVDERRGRPDVVVSTAHKAKGLEWESVRIAEDFKEPKEEEDHRTGEMVPGKIGTSEAMLHYVAITRAQQHLDRDGLAWIDKYADMVTV